VGLERGNEMNKHEQVRLELVYIRGKHTNHLQKAYPEKTLKAICGNAYDNVFNSIDEAEATEKAYQELQREILSISKIGNPLDREIAFDYLIDKLSKGGVEE